MLHSFTAQASYYKELISKHKDWLFVEVYADYGISGTKVNRPEFNRMIDDCKTGKIDMIITKSISRFARNTTLLLSTIRELKALNIDVYFEEQNINSMSEQGELMLTLLASIAEAEAKSMGENVKWRINKTFEQGEIYSTTRFYGYDIIDKKFVVNEEQASVVRRIFQMVLDGLGYIKIIEVLNKENSKSPSGSKWTIRSLERIIKEDTYTDKLTLQKTYRSENHSKKRNLGELRKYIVEDNHEAIIDLNTFNKVQEILASRRNKAKSKYDSNDLFKGMIRCSLCGASYQRKKRYGYNLYDWKCWNYLYSAKSERCKTVGLPESILIEKTKEVLEVDELTSNLVKDKIKVIFAQPNRVLEFVFNDGTKKTIAWKLKSRKFSWTPELRKEARLRVIKRNSQSVKVIEPTRNLHTHKLTIERVKRRVAAYARVSTDSDDQENSFDAQKSFYERYIKENPLWEFVGIYADEGINGTSTKGRKEFQRMINDAKNGKIDLIIAKSMSHFARNTLDTLTYIRDLKARGVECFFQKENIYTFDSKGELLITIMSSLAQEESRSISENVKWGIRKSFADGKVYLPHKNFIGYKYDENKNIIIDKDNEWVIRLIYKEFMSGRTFRQICKILEEKGVKTPSGKYKWSDTTVRSILRNEKYCGSAILQKTFVEAFLTNTTKVNNGEVPKYYVKDSHPGILPKEEWDLAQIELARRKELRYSYSSKNCFSSKLICADCGHLYGSKVWHSNSDKYRKTIWQCNYKFDKKSKKQCQTPTLNEEEIKAMFVDAYNKMIVSKDEIIKNLESVLNEIVSVESIENKIKEVNVELEQIVYEVEVLIHSSLTSDDGNEKQLNLEAKYDALVQKLKKLEHQKDEVMDKQNKMNTFILNLRNKGDVIAEFDEELFNIMIDKAVVHRDKSIEFIFNSGYKVKVEARK